MESIRELIVMLKKELGEGAVMTIPQMLHITVLVQLQPPAFQATDTTLPKPGLDAGVPERQLSYVYRYVECLDFVHWFHLPSAGLLCGSGKHSRGEF